MRRVGNHSITSDGSVDGLAVDRSVIVILLSHAIVRFAEIA